MRRNEDNACRMGPNAPVPHDSKAAADAISAIRKLDLQATSIEQIQELLIPIFRGYAVNAPKFEPGVVLFRSRICDKPTSVSSLLYPPTSFAPLDRVNRERKPVLYCCTSREGSVFECRPKEND